MWPCSDPSCSPSVPVFRESQLLWVRSVAYVLQLWLIGRGVTIIEALLLIPKKKVRSVAQLKDNREEASIIAAGDAHRWRAKDVGKCFGQETQYGPKRRKLRSLGDKHPPESNSNNLWSDPSCSPSTCALHYEIAFLCFSSLLRLCNISLSGMWGGWLVFILYVGFC